MSRPSSSDEDKLSDILLSDVVGVLLDRRRPSDPEVVGDAVTSSTGLCRFNSEDSHRGNAGSKKRGKLRELVIVPLTSSFFCFFGTRGGILCPSLGIVYDGLAKMGKCELYAVELAEAMARELGM